MERFGRHVVSFALLLVPLAASAGTLTSATWLQTAPGLESIEGFPLTRTAADPRWSYAGTSTSTAIAVNVNYFFTSTVFGVPKTPNGFLIDVGVRVTQGGTQAITATAGGGAGTPGIAGRVTYAGGLPSHVGMGSDQSMFELGASTFVSIPLSAGRAGGFTNTFQQVGLNGTITVQFYSWTVGSLSFAGLTSNFVALPPATAMGSFDLTANGGGMVTLVAPSLVSVDSPLHRRRNALFTTLVLNFVPEPSSLLLLSAGAVALLLVSRRASR
jgi:hypothetical protein